MLIHSWQPSIILSHFSSASTSFSMKDASASDTAHAPALVRTPGAWKVWKVWVKGWRQMAESGW